MNRIGGVEMPAIRNEKETETKRIQKGKRDKRRHPDHKEHRSIREPYGWSARCVSFRLAGSIAGARAVAILSSDGSSVNVVSITREFKLSGSGNGVSFHAVGNGL